MVDNKPRPTTYTKTEVVTVAPKPSDDAKPAPQPEKPVEQIGYVLCSLSYL
jgi:hypothetical protein